MLPKADCRVRTYQDTVSDEPGDTAIFGSVSGPESQFLSIELSTKHKILFADYKDTYSGSVDTDTASCTWFTAPNFSVSVLTLAWLFGR